MRKQKYRHQKVIEKKGKFLVMEYSTLSGRNLRLIKILDTFLEANNFLKGYWESRRKNVT